MIKEFSVAARTFQILKFPSVTKVRQKSSLLYRNILVIDDYCARATSMEAIISIEKIKYLTKLGSLP